MKNTIKTVSLNISQYSSSDEDSLETDYDIKVLPYKNSKIHDDSDLKKFVKIYEAKKQFNERKNIEYYITTEDLVITNTNDNKHIYMRLIPESPNKNRIKSREKNNKTEITNIDSNKISISTKISPGEENNDKVSTRKLIIELIKKLLEELEINNDKNLLEELNIKNLLEELDINKNLLEEYMKNSGKTSPIGSGKNSGKNSPIGSGKNSSKNNIKNSSDELGKNSTKNSFGELIKNSTKNSSGELVKNSTKVSSKESGKNNFKMPLEELNNNKEQLNLTSPSHISPKNSQKEVPSPRIKNKRSASIGEKILKIHIEKNTSCKNVVLNNKKFTIKYSPDDILYCIFILENDNNDLLCRGTTDGQIKAEEIYTYKSISINYKYLERNISLTLYSADLSDLTFPIYFLIVTENLEFTTKYFITMIEDILKISLFQYNQNL